MPIYRYEPNPKWTFDSFVIGASNQSAYNAAFAVARHPAKRHNPYIIYSSGVGLGRTHLMHAIGNYMINKRKISNAFYVTSEKFANDLCNAIKSNKYKDFIERYMSVNLLLIDDIQFLGNKPEIKDELICVIKKLRDVGRQIVITCAEHPGKMLNDKETSLIGVKTRSMREIKPPIMKTRIAILTRKARAMRLHMSREVIRFIAKRSSCIRVLEGILIKLKARMELSRKYKKYKLSAYHYKNIYSLLDE